MNFENKKVLVAGVARSGVSAAVLLKRLGADVIVQDIKSADKLGENVELLEAKGIQLYLDKNPDDIVAEQDLIIVSPGVPGDLPFFEKARETNVPVWSEIEFAYSLTKCPIAAITGTNGKTTTTSLTGEILSAYFPYSQVVGNIGVPFSEKVLDLKESSYVIAEISSFQLENIHKFRPKITAVLNITPDHLDRHKTFEKYIEAKEKIFMNQIEEDFCILNNDDEYCKKMKDKTKAKVMFFSRKSLLAEGVFLHENAIYVKWDKLDDKIVDLDDLQTVGVHNIENAMASACIAICAGVPLELIRKIIKNFRGVEHRIEFVTTKNGVDYYNDSKATNPDAAIVGIKAMKKPAIIIGGGYDKASDFSDWVKMFHGKVKYLILIGEVADKIAETAKAYNFNDFVKVNSLKDAVELAYNKAEFGDCVLLSPACASWDMFDNYEQRGELFKQFVLGL